MITMISSMHRNPIIVDELLSTEQFGVDDAALMLLINSFSLLLYQSVPIVRELVLQEWAQFSNGRVEKVKTESGLVANGGEEGVADAFLGSKLNYWVVLAALTFGNEPLNLEEELRRRSKLHFRGGNRASFAKHDFLPREDA
ncbi:hypothetical protein ALC53_12030 [Atta colombica]|uniref:Uncharacterized protein n=1 Tax=Atta colombica TaxID=520822 RepID=A0A195AZA5_9HYME|nr:hypothetical protein ALC53_12030 [Atta colombica]